MPATEMQSSFLGRISIRRNQIAATMEDQEIEDVDIFQKNVAERFADLMSSISAPEEATSPAASSAAASGLFPLLSTGWLRRLLDVFLCCEAEFKAILIMGRDPCQVIKPPLDRLLPELLERELKALDICNAVAHGVESVRHCQRLAEIAVVALTQRPLGEGQVRRAKKALTSLIALMSREDKETGGFTRSWSFGRRGGGSGANKDRPVGQFRAISWSVSKSWSASKQILAMTNNLVAPRGVEATGMALPVYVMSTVMVFVMWALVAALPCQERNGLSSHFPVPKNLAWAQAMTGLHEKIGEEWKRKEKKGSAGLLEEMQRMEKMGHSLIEFAEAFMFPAEEEKLVTVAAQVGELEETCKRLEQGLLPLQQQIREVFHTIVRSRSEFLEALEQAGKSREPAA